VVVPITFSSNLLRNIIPLPNAGAAVQFTLDAAGDYFVSCNINLASTVSVSPIIFRIDVSSIVGSKIYTNTQTGANGGSMRCDNIIRNPSASVLSITNQTPSGSVNITSADIVIIRLN